MTIKAGECLHTYAMNPLVLMTTLARLLIGLEKMEAPAVAYLAIGAEHKDMFRVSVRLSQ